MLKLSIIVPCYNCEKYVEETVNSIIKNCDMSETEIILVNDGSKDNTFEIINHISKNYENIIIINKINEGVSVARNIGLEVAKGNYVGFVDSDDIIVNNMYQKMITVGEKNNSDIVCCSFYEQTVNERNVSKYQYKNKMFNKKEATKRFLINKTSIAVWDKIYKRSLLDGIKFNSLFAVGEDTLFCFDAINNIRTNFYECNLYGYIYMQREGSAVHSVSEKIKEVSLVSNIIFTDEEYKEEYDYFKAYSMMRCINTLSYLKNKNTYNTVKKYILDVYEKNKLKTLVKSKYSSKSLKFEATILLVFGIKVHLLFFDFYDFAKKKKNKGEKL